MKKRNNTIPYCNELYDSNQYVYSIDNIRFEFSLDKQYESLFFNIFSNITRTDIVYHESFRHGSYKHLWTIRYDKTASMTIGYCLNGNDFHSDSIKGFIDLNPNKTGSNAQFWTDYNKIKLYCKYFNIKRCDIALDIPIKRKYLLLEKNNRKYEQISYSHDNKTEYLGRRSNVGFVKLYNKTMESKLDYDISRLEITCLLSLKSFKQYFPAVYDISQQIKLSDELEQLNDTERGIVEMAYILTKNGNDAGLMIFNSMGRYMKEKLKKFILPDQCKITYSEDILEELIKNAMSLYLNE